MWWLALWAVAEATTCAGGHREPWTRVVPLGGQSDGRSLVALATADLDGDGQEEPYGLLSDPDGDGGLELWATVIDERGPLSAVGPVPLVYDTGAPGAGTVHFWGRDVDADGSTDLLVLDLRGKGTLGLWQGHGDGGTSQAWSVTVGADLVAPQLGDLDGDGHLDLYSPTSTGGEWRIPATLERPTPSIGGVPLPLEGVGNPVDAVVADLDGDGTLDLVAAGGTEKTVTWVSGITDYELAVRIKARSKDARQLAAGDLDGDGDDDVIVLDAARGRLRWLEGGASPAVGPVLATLDSAPTDLHLADLDADGCSDLWMPGPDPAVWWGHGDGTFTPQTIDGGPGPWTLGDVDGDGHDELLVGDGDLVHLVDGTPDAPPINPPPVDDFSELQGACHRKSGEQCQEEYDPVRRAGAEMACDGPGTWNTEPCPTDDLIARCEVDEATTRFFYYSPAKRIGLDVLEQGCDTMGGTFTRPE